MWWLATIHNSIDMEHVAMKLCLTMAIESCICVGYEPHKVCLILSSVWYTVAILLYNQNHYNNEMFYWLLVTVAHFERVAVS